MRVSPLAPREKLPMRGYLGVAFLPHIWAGAAAAKLSKQTSFLIYQKQSSCFESCDLGVAGSVRNFCNLLRRFLQPASALKGPTFKT